MCRRDLESDSCLPPHPPLPPQGEWAKYFLQPYITNQPAVDLFVFRSPTPWVVNTAGWETSNCFTELRNYPAHWRARGENATNLPVRCPVRIGVVMIVMLIACLAVCVFSQVEWGKRIACFMPSKRMSSKLIRSLNETYLSGQGGYNEIAVPTINSVSGGTFGTAHEVRGRERVCTQTVNVYAHCLCLPLLPQACMVYSYKNSEAGLMYDSFRERARAMTHSPVSEQTYHDANVPCLLHPVKTSRKVGKAAAEVTTDEASGSVLK